MPTQSAIPTELTNILSSPAFAALVTGGETWWAKEFDLELIRLLEEKSAALPPGDAP